MSKVLQKTLIYIILCSLITCGFASSAQSFASNLSSYIVIEESTNRVLYESNKDVRLPMASTTKIITAIVTIEHADLEEIVTIPKEAQGVEGSSIYLKAGDTYTVRDLLYGLMLRSGNDSAIALAIHVSGDVQSFVDLMNEKALSLGAYNTHFTNPHGLHNDDHYTTAHDLAILTSYAYKNPNFREIVAAKKYKLKDSYIYNKNKLLSSYDGADGVKTGYTTKSGRCLVSSSTRNGMRVICVTLNCYDMWDKSKTLMTQAHQEYSLVKVISKDSTTKVRVFNGIEKECNAVLKEDKYYPLKEEEFALLNYECESYDLAAPVYKDQICGRIKVYLDKHLIFEENIYTINNVRKKTIFDVLK